MLTRPRFAADRLSYEEIRQRLNLQDEDIVRLLHSLSLAKFKILLKDPANKTLAKTDHFSFNAKFTSAMRRIRVRLLTAGGAQRDPHQQHGGRVVQLCTSQDIHAQQWSNVL